MATYLMQSQHMGYTLQLYLQRCHSKEPSSQVSPLRSPGLFISPARFAGTQNKIYNRGSPQLRRAIWLAATVAAFPSLFFAL